MHGWNTRVVRVRIPDGWWVSYDERLNAYATRIRLPGGAQASWRERLYHPRSECVVRTADRRVKKNGWTLVVRIRLPAADRGRKMNGWTLRGTDTLSWRRIASEDERLDPSRSGRPTVGPSNTSSWPRIREWRWPAGSSVTGHVTMAEDWLAKLTGWTSRGPDRQASDDDRVDQPLSIYVPLATGGRVKMTDWTTYGPETSPWRRIGESEDDGAGCLAVGIRLPAWRRMVAWI